MTNFGPTLETERLILRVPQAADFERFAEVLGNEEAARYIGGAQPRAAIWRRFLQMPGAWLLQGFGMFSALAQRLGSRNLGPVTLPSPFEDAPSDAWGQTRAEWVENRRRFA